MFGFRKASDGKELDRVGEHLRNFGYDLTEYGSTFAPLFIKNGFKEAEVACHFAHVTLARDALDAGDNFMLLVVGLRLHGMTLLEVLKEYKDAGYLRREHWERAAKSIYNAITPSKEQIPGIQALLADPISGTERVATSRLDYSTN
jgi:hypothetical protein